jgi:futalosine hydrolase
LIAVAVAAEADAVRAGIADRATIAVVGVGPAAAAASTARLLALAEAAGSPFDGVISAGIGGGFADRVPLGGIALAATCVAADLGADSPDGFLSLESLGFGVNRLPATLPIACPGAVAGDILTVSTVTGTAAAAEALRKRHPDAVAEGMEGFGVATAAHAAGVPFAEIRAVSNFVGPRDRDGWQIGPALGALTAAVRTL